MPRRARTFSRADQLSRPFEAPDGILAQITIDGEEFLSFKADDVHDARRFYEEAIEHVPEGREFALFEWKPRHGIYLRSKLHIR